MIDTATTTVHHCIIVIIVVIEIISLRLIDVVQGVLLEILYIRDFHHIIVIFLVTIVSLVFLALIEFIALIRYIPVIKVRHFNYLHNDSIRVLNLVSLDIIGRRSSLKHALIFLVVIFNESQLVAIA